MRIVTPTEIEHMAWEDYLDPLGETFSGCSVWCPPGIATRTFRRRCLGAILSGLVVSRKTLAALHDAAEGVTAGVEWVEGMGEAE